MTAQGLLSKALAECDWIDIKKCIGAPDGARHASHRLLHLHVEPGPTHDACIMVVASRYVAEKLAEQGGAAHIEHLRDLVNLSSLTPAYRAAAGLFFESYAHRILRKGGRFQVSFLSCSDLHTHCMAWLTSTSEPRISLHCSLLFEYCFALKVRRLDGDVPLLEILELHETDHIHGFNNIEEVKEKPAGDYCLPKVGEGQS